MKNNSPTVTFRIPHDVDAKLKRYMAAINETNKSRCLNKALEAGIDYLESIGWDASRVAAGLITSKSSALPIQSSNLTAPIPKLVPDAQTRKILKAK